LVAEGTVVPLELAHLGVGKKTFEDDLGASGLERLGRKKCEQRVGAVTQRLVSALLLYDVVISGGNAKNLKRLRAGRQCQSLAGRTAPSEESEEWLIAFIVGEAANQLHEKRKRRCNSA
jgi:hypothetical protein